MSPTPSTPCHRLTSTTCARRLPTPLGGRLTLPRPKIRDEAGQDANRVLPLALDSLVPPGWRSLAAKRGVGAGRK